MLYINKIGNIIGIQTVYFTIVALVLVFGGSDVLGKQKKTLLGVWEFNPEETQKLQPKRARTKTTKSGFGNIGVSVGGMPVPRPGRGAAAASRGTSVLPKVLSCNKLTLSEAADEILMTCPSFKGTREFRIGKHHGRTVRWRDKRLTEKYSSTSRRVTHDFQLRKSDQMHVEVVVTPKQSSRLKYLVVFDRASSKQSNEQKEKE